MIGTTAVSFIKVGVTSKKNWSSLHELSYVRKKILERSRNPQKKKNVRNDYFKILLKFKKKKLSSTERSFKNGDEERHEIVNDSRTCVQFYIQINGLLLD